MDNHHSHAGSGKGLIVVIFIILAAYIFAAALGLPQKATDMIVAASAHAEHQDESTEHEGEHTADEHAAQQQDSHGEEHFTHPPLFMVLPFALLLGAIALLPLIPFTEHWWESNRNRFIVAATLGAFTLCYYLWFHDFPVESHWPAHDVVMHNDSGANLGTAWTVLANAILGEYIPFIMLLFSLYTISGGIRIEGNLQARPLTNTTFLAAGGLLASFIGTTGAAMLLIRPLLETNHERKNVKHTVIFFIFVVCNCGGCLLPIGDPPLFLGYLRGVPFTWTFALWPEWLFVNGMLIIIYFLWDHFVCYPKEKMPDIVRDETQTRRLQFSGLWPNALLLLGVIFSVALLDPSKALPGTDWHPWLYLREIAQLGLVAVSLILGSELVRRANNFNYHAIIEVAALFFGIFICMQPPLQVLNVRGPDLGLSSPMHFFWATGSLSSVLDNAPTYVVFFETAKTLGGESSDLVAGVAHALLAAISLGAVFMGAMTYIGNGPNFMVKAIAEKSGIRMPSFFGYMLYSCVVLLPLFVLTTIIFQK